MATHSSILDWEIPCTEEPGRLQSMGSQRIGHDLVIKQQQIQNLWTPQKGKQAWTIWLRLPSVDGCFFFFLTVCSSTVWNLLWNRSANCMNSWEGTASSNRTLGERCSGYKKKKKLWGLDRGLETNASPVYKPQVPRGQQSINGLSRKPISLPGRVPTQTNQ